MTKEEVERAEVAAGWLLAIARSLANGVPLPGNYKGISTTPHRCHDVLIMASAMIAARAAEILGRSINGPEFQFDDKAKENS